MFDQFIQKFDDLEQWLVIFTTPYYMVLILTEVLLSNYKHLNLYSIKDTISNVYLMILNSGIDILFRGIYVGVVFTWAYNHRIMEWENAYLYWISLLIGEDFLFYWLHRFDHQIRFFWAAHVTHHSSEKMNFSVGFRSSVFQPLYRFIYFFPLPFLGFRPLDVVFIFSATQIWGIFVHTRLIHKLGWLEYFLVTPSHHRVHHGSNPKYLDKNMGMFLIIWDKLFGTFQEELSDHQYQTIKYGLTKNLAEIGPANLVFHEWKAIIQDVLRKDISWTQRLKYIFGLPGWSHDGSRLTSRELRIREDQIKEIDIQ